MAMPEPHRRAKSDLPRHGRLASGFVPRDSSFSVPTMRSPSLSRIAVLSLTIALGAMPQTACHKKAQEAKGSDDKTTLAASRAEAEQSLERLRSQIGALRKALSEVHQRLDALPEDMPDLDAFRSKLFSVEEVFGVEDGRVKWLASKLN